MLEQAQKDYLTGFFLRAALLPFLEKLILEANPQGRHFSLAVIDLDRFKKFNDKFGHIFGDEILKYAAATLRLTFSETQSHCFRYGGDEFIAVFPNLEPREAFHLLRQCGYNLVHRPFLFKNKLYRITFSTGISSFPPEGKTPEELIKKADQAMYFSKRRGRSLVTLAGRIKFLKLRRFFIQIISAGLILCAAFILYQGLLKKFVQPAVSKIKGMRITTKPKDLDKIILKNGTIFEGYIVAENNNEIILNLYLDKEEGTMSFNKNEIAQIEFGLKTSHRGNRK